MKSDLSRLQGPGVSRLAQIFLTTFAASVAGAIGDANATPVSVPNGSFDTQTVAPSPYVGPPITDWTPNAGATGAAYGLYLNSYLVSQGFTGGNGNNSAYINTTSNGNSPASITSNNITAAAANTTYTVTVAVGNYGNIAGDDTIELLEGGVVVASATILHSSLSQTMFMDATPLTYTTAPNDFSGGQLQVVLQTAYDGANNSYNAGAYLLQQSVFDNVRLDATPVPEPASALGLIGMGSVTLLRRRWG